MTTTFRPRFSVPPGAHLEEKLEELGMTQAELARRTGLSQKHINQLIAGDVSLSPRTAVLLERVTGMPASLWNNYESRWQTHLAAEQADRELEPLADWAARFPVGDMRRRDAISTDASGPTLVAELLRFFGIAQADKWDTVYERVVTAQYRAAHGRDRNPYAVAAWLREAEIEATNIHTEPFDAKRARALPDTVRQVVRNATSAAQWWPELVYSFSQTGIALVLVPEYPGLTKLNGATQWQSPSKAVIAVTGRHKRADVLWFTVMHELAHVLLHKKRQTFIDLEDGAASDSPEEQEADAFAVHALIPEDLQPEFADIPKRDLKAAVRFADRHELAVGAVIGRLQREGRLPHHFGSKQHHEWLNLDEPFWSA
jgi:HTH-type transcriptional regulator / antitoxin HigA